MLYLDVPYEEKDIAKTLGAKWNANLKKWYVENHNNYYKFKKWINIELCKEIIALDHIYIAEANRKCFKCGEMTKVIGFCVDDYYRVVINSNDNTIDDFEHITNDFEITTIDNPTRLPNELLEFLEKKYKYKYGYSKFIKESYYSNHCQNCGIIQGNYPLFSEPDSPLFITDQQKASNITLYKYKLSNDTILSKSESITLVYNQEKLQTASELVNRFSKKCILDLKSIMVIS